MKGVPLTVYGVFCFTRFANCCTHKFIAPEARFHAESICVSPVIIAHKTAKLFKFLQVHVYCQHECTNKAYMYAVYSRHLYSGVRHTVHMSGKRSLANRSFVLASHLHSSVNVRLSAAGLLLVQTQNSFPDQCKVALVGRIWRRSHCLLEQWHGFLIFEWISLHAPGKIVRNHKDILFPDSFSKKVWTLLVYPLQWVA